MPPASVFRSWHQHPYENNLSFIGSIVEFYQPLGGEKEQNSRTAFLACLLGDHLTSYTVESFDITLLWQKMIAL